MVGTFWRCAGSAPNRCQQRKLTADVTGEVETEEGVLVIRRIHVAMHLVAAEAARETVERAHGFYAMRCPLYRTLHKTILLTSSFGIKGSGKQLLNLKGK